MFIVVLFLLLFFLKINDSVEFKEGVIYSNNPQLKIKTPSEGKVSKVFVKEGQSVRKGDTLFILNNLKTKTDYEIAIIDLESMRKKIEVTNLLINNAIQKKDAVLKLISIQRNIHNIDKQKAEQEIKNLNNKIKLSTQQSVIIKNRHITDSILYAKGAISKNELLEQQNKKIDDKKNIDEIESNFKQKNYDYQNIFNNFSKTKNDLNQTLIGLDNDIVNYKKEILELETQIKNKEYSIEFIFDELNKLTVIAPFNGTISNIFNAKQNIQIIDKGELLAILAPSKEKFYAKITLPEKDLTYIKKNQEVNLKIDAYNYYKFGAIKGNIEYITPSDIDKNFYCIANLKEYKSSISLKAGYKFKGEIIVERMRLYEFLIKKLFNKIDDNVNQNLQNNSSNNSNLKKTN
ncbi:HlyD family secretion protein [Flavobacterium sp.]|uniref:HlyD family secretion protein n=1 Tax=Flavobacterium sp. TaxID=239 RepID=UPI003F6A4843